MYYDVETRVTEIRTYLSVFADNELEARRLIQNPITNADYSYDSEVVEEKVLEVVPDFSIEEYDLYEEWDEDDDPYI